MRQGLRIGGENMEDEQSLLSRARLGDRDAFGALYERYSTRFNRYFYARTSDRQVAEDLTSDLFLNAWKSLPTYTDMGVPFSAYLCRIAHNRLVNYYISNRQVNVELTEQILFQPEFDDDLERATRWQAMKKAMEELPEKMRKVVLLSCLSEMSAKDIGKELALRESNVRAIKTRAIDRLQSLVLS